MLVGTNKLVLNEATVRVAIEDYVNKYLVGSRYDVRVTDVTYLDEDNEYRVTMNSKHIWRV